METRKLFLLKLLTTRCADLVKLGHSGKMPVKFFFKCLSPRSLNNLDGEFAPMYIFAVGVNPPYGGIWKHTVVGNEH